ncbi:PilW family protein [Lignipirellula cremea]|uniref:Uncharacterized protein n=1 Tax=Lignipirellula cremea TaxID=2528010 RepID=A0A518DMX2_9BACT|nr:hypothetical protein [Lignipirellula cremea]QDU93172.1 hypothetical protein Pla8534_09510 [Lignipirellula cremea]
MSFPRYRRGLTLVELLVSTSLSLIIIYAVVHVFGEVGREISASRSLIEMSGATRNTRDRLDRDLATISVPVRPWPELSAAAGYFEYIEFSESDKVGFNRESTLGDTDDVLMFTAYSPEEPFVGQILGTPALQSNGRFLVTGTTPTIIEAYAAEIIYWTSFNDSNGNGVLDTFDPTGSQIPERMKLHRRVLLVRPDFDFPTGVSTNFYQNNDVSVRRAPGSTNVIANSLADLTQRENRFAHDIRFLTGGAAPAFPAELTRGMLTALELAGTRQGEDVIAAEISAFDVQAFDPLVPVLRKTMTDGSFVAITPNDPGYAAPTPATTTVLGEYVNLGFGFGVGSHFSGAVNNRSQLTRPTYDTWSWHYEADGVDQDGDGLIDEGTNHLDDEWNGSNHSVNVASGGSTGVFGIDDETERETSPPYPVPLRGIRVTVRMVEHDSQQVRQIAVAQNFVPK